MYYHLKALMCNPAHNIIFVVNHVHARLSTSNMYILADAAEFEDFQKLEKKTMESSSYFMDTL
jgi:hypothetical protein